MIKGTFCDWLMMQGVRFHPDTVIVEASESFISAIESKFTMEEKRTLPMRPAYPYMFVEGILVASGDDYESIRHKSRDSKKIGFYVRKCQLPPLKNYAHANVAYSYHAMVITVDMLTRRTMLGSQILLTFDECFNRVSPEYQEDLTKKIGYIIGEVEQMMVGAYGNLKLMDFPEQLEASGWFINNLLAQALIHFLMPSTVEHVDYTPVQKKVIKNREGKEPSPYFRILTPGKPQKRYKSNGNGSSIKNMPIHTVRGHFRHVENHPIEHFNGTHWITPHTRGDKKLGKIQAHYKIRLPDDQQEAS